MGKAAFKAKRSDMFRFDPDELVLVEDEDDFLSDSERRKIPLEELESLVRSIMVRGVIEPVVVTKRGDRPVVVDGRQRVKASREANRRLAAEGAQTVLVPCVLRTGDSKDLAAVSVAANEIRRAESVLARARKASRLLNLGLDEGEVADAFGVTTQAVKNWTALLSCSAPVLKAVERGQLAASAASKLAALTPTQQREALAAGKVTARDAQRKAAKASGRARAPRMRSRKEIEARLTAGADSAAFQEALEWVLG